MCKVIAYGQTKTGTKKELMDFYLDCAEWCEGAERDRYMYIYFELKNGRKLVNSDTEMY